MKMRERSENLDLEIEFCTLEIEKHLGSLSDNERWIIRYAFLSGNTYGLTEARQICEET